jgi:hypothetical protein
VSMTSHYLDNRLSWPYVPASLAPQKHSLLSISFRGWVNPRAIVRLKVLGIPKTFSYLIGSRTHDLPACSIMPQPTLIPPAPKIGVLHKQIMGISPTLHGSRRKFNRHKLWRFLSKPKSYYDRQSVGQSVLVSDPHPGPATKLSFFLTFSLDSCGFVIL